MTSLTARTMVCKKILFAAALGSACAPTILDAATRTWTNNNGAGDNIWTNASNWIDIQVPTAADAARILNGSGTTISLRSSTGSVSVGTLLLDSASYTNIVAGASAVTMNMGSGSTSAARVDHATPVNLNLGEIAGGATNLTLNVPGALQLRLASDKLLWIGANINGTGSLELSRLSGSGDGTVNFNQNSGDIAADDALSTFSGGVTVGSNIYLNVTHSSAQSGTTITNGPLGTGAARLAGGTMTLRSRASNPSVSLHNPILLTADSTIATASQDTDDTFSLSGVAVLSSVSGSELVGHRLSFATLHSLKFDDAVFLSTDAGTMSFVNSPPDVVDVLNIHVSTGTSTFGGAVGELANASDLQHVHGKVIKTGSGTFETARHFRLNALDIQGGTLRVLSSGTNEIGSESGTSRLNRINFDDNHNPTARLDLRNNDLIVDWKTGDPPTGSLTSASTGGGIARMIQVGYNAGSWNGNGIMSSLATYNDYAVGYATASNVLTFMAS